MQNTSQRTFYTQFLLWKNMTFFMNMKNTAQMVCLSVYFSFSCSMNGQVEFVAHPLSITGRFLNG